MFKEIPIQNTYNNWKKLLIYKRYNIYPELIDRFFALDKCTPISGYYFFKKYKDGYVVFAPSIMINENFDWINDIKQIIQLGIDLDVIVIVSYCLKKITKRRIIIKEDLSMNDECYNIEDKIEKDMQNLIEKKEKIILDNQFEIMRIERKSYNKVFYHNSDDFYTEKYFENEEEHIAYEEYADVKEVRGYIYKIDNKK